MSLTSFLVLALTSSLIVAQTLAPGSNPVINYGLGENAQCIAPEDLNRDIWPVLPANGNSDYVSVLVDTTADDTATTLTALPASPTYGDTVTLTATVTAGASTPSGEVQFRNGSVQIGTPVPLAAGQATYTTSTLPAGTHTLTAEFMANEAYNGSTSDPRTVIVAPAPLTITAEDKNKVYGAHWPAFTLSYSGFVNGETASVLDGVLILITSAHWYDDVNDYPISPSGLESTNYDITFVDGTLHITPAPLTVRADDKTKLYGDPLPAFTASYSGFVMGQNPSVLGGALLLTTTADPSSHVGTYPIVPSDLTSTNYAITFVPGTLTITRTDTTTTLDSSANPSTQGLAITFTATVSPASAGGTVAFKSDGGNVTGCAAQALTGGQTSCTTSALPVGTHVITVEYGGDANHNGSSGTLSPDQQVSPPTALQLTGFGAVPANRARFAPFALLLLVVLSVSLIVKQCAAGGSGV